MYLFWPFLCQFCSRCKKSPCQKTFNFSTRKQWKLVRRVYLFLGLRRAHKLSERSAIGKVERSFKHSKLRCYQLTLQRRIWISSVFRDWLWAANIIHRRSNSSMSTLQNAQVKKRRHHVYVSQTCAVKINLLFGFVSQEKLKVDPEPDTFSKLRKQLWKKLIFWYCRWHELSGRDTTKSGYCWHSQRGTSKY